MFFSSSHLGPALLFLLSSTFLPYLPVNPLARSSLSYHQPLTFTPRVEEDDDVLAGVVNCWLLVLRRLSRDSEAEQADHSGGRGVHGQLDLVAGLLCDLGLPAIVLQVLHQRNDDVGSFGHDRQGTYETQDRIYFVGYRLACLKNSWICSGSLKLFIIDSTGHVY